MPVWILDSYPLINAISVSSKLLKCYVCSLFNLDIKYLKTVKSAEESKKSIGSHNVHLLPVQIFDNHYESFIQNSEDDTSLNDIKFYLTKILHWIIQKLSLFLCTGNICVLYSSKQPDFTPSGNGTEWFFHSIISALSSEFVTKYWIPLLHICKPKVSIAQMIFQPRICQ